MSILITKILISTMIKLNYLLQEISKNELTFEECTMMKNLFNGFGFRKQNFEELLTKMEHIEPCQPCNGYLKWATETFKEWMMTLV